MSILRIRSSILAVCTANSTVKTSICSGEFAGVYSQSVVQKSCTHDGELLQYATRREYCKALERATAKS